MTMFLMLKVLLSVMGEKNKLFRLIRRQGLAREFPLIIATVRAFSQGRIKIIENKTVVDADNRPIIGYDMTAEIDKSVRQDTIEG